MPACKRPSLRGKTSGAPAPRITTSSAENGPIPGSSRTASNATSAGMFRRRRPSSRPSSAASARARSRCCFTSGTGRSPATSTSRAGTGKAQSGTSSTRWRVPKRCAIRSLTAAAAALVVRWESTAQQAASYGEEKHTGRRPGWRAASASTTGSAARTAPNPEPSTSSDRIRVSCARRRSGAPSGTRATTAPPTSSCTATPTASVDPSTGKASRRVASPVPRYRAGVKPSRKRMPAASEKGPRTGSGSVFMPDCLRRGYDSPSAARVQPAREEPGQGGNEHVAQQDHDDDGRQQQPRLRRPRRQVRRHALLEDRGDGEDGGDGQHRHPPARARLRRAGEETLQAGDPVVPLVVHHLLDVRQRRPALLRALPGSERLVVLEAVDQVVLGAARAGVQHAGAEVAGEARGDLQHVLGPALERLALVGSHDAGDGHGDGLGSRRIVVGRTEPGTQSQGHTHEHL